MEEFFKVLIKQQNIHLLVLSLQQNGCLCLHYTLLFWSQGEFLETCGHSVLSQASAAEYQLYARHCPWPGDIG